MTEHVDRGTQIRLLALMGVEARLGRAETAPQTGIFDEQVNSVESAIEEEKEHECKFDSSDEEISDWIHECMEVWGDEVATAPHGRAGDTAKRDRAKRDEFQ